MFSNSFFRDHSNRPFTALSPSSFVEKFSHRSISGVSPDRSRLSFTRDLLLFWPPRGRPVSDLHTHKHDTWITRLLHTLRMRHRRKSYGKPYVCAYITCVCILFIDVYTYTLMYIYIYWQGRGRRHRVSPHTHPSQVAVASSPETQYAGRAYAHTHTHARGPFAAKIKVCAAAA